MLSNVLIYIEYTFENISQIIMENTFAIPMRNILDNGKKLPKKLFSDLKRYILGSEFRSLASLEEQIIFLRKCFISLTVDQITTLLDISFFSVL